LGLLLAVKVHSAGLIDRHGAPLLLGDLVGRFPRVCVLFADGGYAGTLLEWIKTHLGWDTEIVPKPDPWVLVNGELTRLSGPKGGFLLQRQRWKVERTLAWLIRYRRLARDYEGLPQSGFRVHPDRCHPALSNSLGSFPFGCNVVPTHSQ